MTQHLNRNCPHCGGYLVVLTEEDPMSFNFESKTKIICTKCAREIKEEELNNVTTPHNPLTNNLESDSTANQGTEIPTGAMMGWICPNCGRVLSPYIDECPCSIKYEFTCNSNLTAPLKIEDIGNCEV